MNRAHLLLAMLLAVLMPRLASAQEAPQPKSGQFCWPVHFAGIVLGITQDSQVQRLLGRGAYRPTEEEGVRYFIDVKRSATLRVATYTDAIVGQVTLSRGVDASLSTKEAAAATSKFFNPSEGFGNWHKLTLGASKLEVLGNLGEPARRESENQWVYDAARTCELPEYITFFFQAGVLVKVVFAAPPG